MLNYYGIDSKNDEHEILEEDKEYKQKINEIQKKSNDAKNIFSLVNEHILFCKFAEVMIDNEKKFETYIYEVNFSKSMMKLFPNTEEKKFGLIFGDASVHNLKMNLCSDFPYFEEKKVILICKRKVYLKEEELKSLIICHFFMCLGILGHDVQFMELYTGHNIKNKFVFDFKGKNKVKFKINDELLKKLGYPLSLVLLKKNDEIDWDSVSEIKRFLDILSPIYDLVNDNKIANCEKLDFKFNLDFLKASRKKKKPGFFNKMLLLNINNFQKYSIFDMKKINNIELQKLKIGKYSLYERKGYLEKKMDIFLNQDDFVVYCTALYKDPLRNLKYFIFEEKDRSVTYALPFELMIYPINLSMILLGQWLPFVFEEAKNFLNLNFLKRKILIPLEYSINFGSNPKPLEEDKNSSKKEEYHYGSIIFLLENELLQIYKNKNVVFLQDDMEEKGNKEIFRKEKMAIFQIEAQKIETNNIKRKYEPNEDDLTNIKTKRVHLAGMEEKNINLYEKRNFMGRLKIISKQNFKCYTSNISEKELKTALTFRIYDVFQPIKNKILIYLFF